MIRQPVPLREFYSSVAELALVYDVEEDAVNALWEAMEGLENDSLKSKVYSDLEVIHKALRRNGIGSLCDVDYILELKLTQLGRHLAYDLIEVKFPQKKWRQIVNAANVMNFG